MVLLEENESEHNGMGVEDIYIANTTGLVNA